MSKNHLPHDERRDSIRAKRIITVRHKIVKHNGRRVSNSMWQMSTTQDMSLSGLLFVSAIPYHIGDIVEIQVVMSGVLDIFNGYGKVVRLSRNKGGYFHVAVKYVELKAKTRSAKSLLPSARN